MLFAFEKRKNISFVRFVFNFLQDFILHVQNMMCTISVYHCHNRPVIPPALVVTTKAE